jgi:uncharacterized membrane protein
LIYIITHCGSVHDLYLKLRIMNSTHLHLLINHLPIFGSILGGIVLAHSLNTKSSRTNIAAYNVLIISAIGAVITYLTGESAEETVENIPGISKSMLEQHEDASQFALVGMITLGIAALAGLYFSLKKSSAAYGAAWTIFIISIVSFFITMRAGYLGGQIRHTEINSNTVQLPPDQKGDDD